MAHSCLMMLDVFSWIPDGFFDLKTTANRLWSRCPLSFRVRTTYLNIPLPLCVTLKTDHPPQIFGVNIKKNPTPPSQYLELFKATKWWNKNMIRTSTTTFFDIFLSHQPWVLCSKDYLAICPQVQQGLQWMSHSNITKTTKIPICCSWSNHRENNWGWSTKLVLNKCLI